MIALPKIRLWDEFWHYRLQPDKGAFAEVIRDWPPALLTKLRHVIKLRFGDERFTAPSIMEAMQNLGFWPLDTVTQGVLIELGNADHSSESDLRGRLDKLRRYSFYVLASGAAHDFECIRTLSAADAAALIRGLNIAEECGYSQSGGSVSMVNWSFAVFRQQHPLPVWAELADWIITHSTHPYIPFNFQRTRHQWEACREGSPSPAETWRRVGDAESRRQREKADIPHCGEQVPDGLRSAQAGGDGCGQEAQRCGLRADALPPEPHHGGQGGNLRARLREHG